MTPAKKALKFKDRLLFLLLPLHKVYCKLTIFAKINIWSILGWSDAVSVICPITDHICDLNC